MKRKSDRNRCRALNKDGEPCRAAATPGGLCFFHANPNMPRELGRIGGRRNRHFPISSSPIARLDTANAVRDEVSRLIEDIHSGKIHHRVGSSLAPLLSLQLRAIEISELELRIAKLEHSSHTERVEQPPTHDGERSDAGMNGSHTSKEGEQK